MDIIPLQTDKNVMETNIIDHIPYNVNFLAFFDGCLLMEAKFLCCILVQGDFNCITS